MHSLPAAMYGCGAIALFHDGRVTPAMLRFERTLGPKRCGSSSGLPFTLKPIRDTMKQYEFCLEFLDRLELRESHGAFVKLNDLGAQGWRVVHVRDDPKHTRDLAFFMEREKPAQPSRA